jgi:hypothetical protein
MTHISKVYFDAGGDGITTTADAQSIFVSKGGDDTSGTGSLMSPYLTVTKAFTEVSSTRKFIAVLPGAYNEAAYLSWPSVNQVVLSAPFGNVVISNADAAAQVIAINPTFTTATFEAYIQGIEFAHDTQVGLQVNNTNMGSRKLLIGLDNVSFSEDGGNSIDVDHATADQAIRIYAKNCDEIEGAVNFLPGSGTADDRLRFTNCVLSGGLTVQDVAVAAELSLINCLVKAGALTTGNAATKTNTIGSFYRTDAGVYTQLANAYDT